MAGRHPHQVAIRADMSSRIGMGHVMRCRTLGLALLEQGYHVTLISAGVPDAVAQRLRDENFSLVTCATAVPDAGIAALCALRPDLVITDAYHLAPADFECLTAAGIPYAVIDDEAMSSAREPVLLIDHNPGAAGGTYAHLPSSMLLIGSGYTLIRPEVRSLVGGVDRDSDTICLSLGGADPQALTEPLALALAEGGWQVRVVIGEVNARSSEVRARLAGGAGISCLEPVDLPSALRTSSVAVLGAGITLWEACFLRTPVVAVCTQDIHLQIARAAAGWGVAAVAVDPDDPAMTLAAVTDACATARPGRAGPVAGGRPGTGRASRGANGDRGVDGVQVIDGRGAERIAAAISAVLA